VRESKNKTMILLAAREHGAQEGKQNDQLETPQTETS